MFKRLEKFKRFMLIISPACFFVLELLSCKPGVHRIHAKDRMTILTGDSLWQRAVNKFSLSFNDYRRKNDLPLLPENFYVVNWGQDFIEWTNPENEWPAYESKIIVWAFDGPYLLWEHDLVRGKNGDRVRLRYIRKNSDFFLEHYDSVPLAHRADNDSLFNRYYSYYFQKGGILRLNKYQYDSVLHVWGVKL